MTKKITKSKEYIKDIIINGSKAEKLALYQFDKFTEIDKIIKKFNLFVIGNYPRYFKNKAAPFHEEMIENYIRSYLGEYNYLNIGFRGCAKTTLKKLFVTYILLNDRRVNKRNYMKVNTKDTTNSKQIVTDIYNLIVEVSWLYGDVFEKEGKVKREETMGSFTMKDGRKFKGGTVGQTQRGHVADANRPDWIWFEDIEDSETVRSQVKTIGIIAKADEAIQGLSDDGTFVCTANYISEEGVIEWFKMRKGIKVQITPIIDKKGKPTWNKYSIEKIKEIKGTAEDWEGDYLCDPTSGKDKFFDIKLIKKKLNEIEKEIKEINNIKIYDKYVSHHKYGIGGDTAEGIGRDSNAMTLFDFTKNKVIGTYHNNEIAPDMFGYEMSKLGRMYGECIVAPERNNTGHATLAALKEDNYSNIYTEIKTDKYTDEQTEKLGWGTDRKTKPVMWFEFKKDFEDNLIDIKDKELLEEMLHYTKADFNERTTGVITRHYDLLTSAVIGWQMKNYALSNNEEDSSCVF